MTDSEIPQYSKGTRGAEARFQNCVSQNLQKHQVFLCFVLGKCVSLECYKCSFFDGGCNDVSELTTDVETCHVGSVCQVSTPAIGKLFYKFIKTDVIIHIQASSVMFTRKDK